MKIAITNTEIVLTPESDEEEDAVIGLKEKTAFYLKGYRHDRRFLLGMWDGKNRLITKRKGQRMTEFAQWSAPIGMLEDVFASLPVDVVEDNRRPVGGVLPIEFDPAVVSSLRYYQREAVDAFLQDREYATGKGMLRLPTRSGKTVIAAGIIAELGVRTLFVVQSHLLLQQTFDFFTKALRLSTRKGKRVRQWEKKFVTMFGAGTLEIGWVTVASVQSLTCHFGTKRVRELLDKSDLVVFDEAHHLEGDVWRKVVLESDAPYKLGLSATISVRDWKEEQADSSIWLVAATGPVLYGLEPSQLIEEGWLCRPVVTFVNAPEPEVEFEDFDTWHTMYREAIVENEGRNALIAKIAKRHVLAGDRVLVTLKQVRHVQHVKRALKAGGLSVAEIVGKTKPADRVKQTEAFKTGALDVMIGTVFGEGVDLPWLDVVIVADALQSSTLTLQRLRNLTPYDSATGKASREPMEEAIEVHVYDFVDTATKILTNHTRERLRTYRENEAFKIRWNDEDEG